MQEIDFNRLFFYTRYLKNSPKINKYREIEFLLKELPNFKPNYSLIKTDKHVFINLDYRSKVLDLFLYHKLLKNYGYKISERVYSYMPKRGLVSCVKNVYLDFLSHRYFMKLDIKEFFLSIDKSKILDIISDFIYRELVKRLIYLRKGLPLGLVISGFLSNLYLQPLDKFLEPYSYYRYADDFVIFSNNKHQLHNLKFEIIKILLDLNLSLNENKTIIGCNNLEFLGYVLTRDGVFPRTNILKNFFIKIEKLQIAQINAYKPWFFFKELFC